jgi:hypothetical protein
MRHRTLPHALASFVWPHLQYCGQVEICVMEQLVLAVYNLHMYPLTIILFSVKVSNDSF